MNLTNASIIRGPVTNATNSTSHTLVSLNNWSEETLIAMGVPFPLPLNAMRYWSTLLGLSLRL
jgi:hypothetical protein